MDEKEKCCICGKEIEGMGNNPYPVRTCLCNHCLLSFAVFHFNVQLVIQ